MMTPTCSRESDMRIFKLQFGRTVNTGNYTSARIDAEMSVGENEDPDEAMDVLRNFIDSQVYKTPAQPRSRE